MEYIVRVVLPLNLSELGGVLSVVQVPVLEDAIEVVEIGSQVGGKSAHLSLNTSENF